LICINAGAAMADDNGRNEQQPMESLVSGPNPNGGVGTRRTAARVLKDIGLFFAAPWVTVAYLAMFPFVAIKMVAQARRQRKQAG
jgi:hypothetical protein